MATLYVASTETFVGKSATCVGLLDRARRDGFTAGYMKPVSVSVVRTEDALLDEDAVFIRQHFGLTDPIDKIAPVLVTQRVVEGIIRGQQADYSKRLREAYLAISRDKDFVVLEGANHWAEGSLVDLSADQVSDMLQAPVLLITRYRATTALDAVLAVQRYLGDRLLGVLINGIEEPQLDFVRSRMAPFLEKRGIAVFATLAQDPQLAGVTVTDLHEHLGRPADRQPGLGRQARRASADRRDGGRCGAFTLPPPHQQGGLHRRRSGRSPAGRAGDIDIGAGADRQYPPRAHR